MITCDVDHVIRTADECRARHAEAVKRAIFREKTKRPAKYDPCRACPEGIEAMKKEKESMGHQSYVDGTCVVCGGQKKVFSHSKKCGACTKREQRAGKPKPAEQAKAFPGPILLPPAVVTAKPAAEPTPKPAAEPKNPSSMTLTLTLPMRLVERLVAKSSAELRTPENQALWMLMEVLR